MNQTMPPKWLALAEHIYRALLSLYPADYRREYGVCMVQVFRDVSRARYQNQGTAGVMLWWCKILLDLALTVTEQWKKVELTMNKSTFVQMTDSLLVTGGAFVALAAFSQFQPGNNASYTGIYQLLAWLLAPGFLFIGLGCIGLGMRYELAFGTLGQWLLYVTGIGAIIMAGGIIAVLIQDSHRNLWFVSSILHTAALTVFGLMHLRKPTLPIFRGLPLQMATGWLVLILGWLQTNSETANNALAFLMVIGMGLAWLGIGLALHRQQRNPTPVMA